MTGQGQDGPTPDLREVLARELETARQRTLGLLDPLSEEAQLAQHSSLVSPVVWDLAHVGNYEELWLLRVLTGVSPIAPEYDDVYDAFRHARKERGRLRLLSPTEARTYIRGVRGQVLDRLGTAELDPRNRLETDGFIYGMVIQHEHQHDETILATLQLWGHEYHLEEEPAPLGKVLTPREVRVEGGPFVMGTSTEPWAYDNERPAHVVELDPFWIDAALVTNREYLEFIEDGGYHEASWWSEAGWAWRVEGALEHPRFWLREGPSSWSRVRFGRREPLPAHEPVQHVCWYEAQAYARFRGKRLPTEAEWEKAASWNPVAGSKRRHPWGDSTPGPALANLGQRRFGPAPVGAFPAGVSAWGCHQMLGDVWEWTASDFQPYPGYAAFPYREYSEVFFGDNYKVLRGGSWATHPTAIRTTFRNWDFPIRRHIFCGFRLARDA
ncbi:MAG: ergothioneine biosynthesis protein EgtB [Actinomycetota bacterium]